MATAASSSSSGSGTADGGTRIQQLAPLTKYKLVFLGDPNVGKTAIITRFMYDTFSSSYEVRPCHTNTYTFPHTLLLCVCSI